MMKKLSVICVTFNDEEGIRRTLESLVPLIRSAGNDVEVLVQDGGSDFALDSLEEDYPFAVFRSEPDSGIYDGMNKALLASSGSHIWFLNGGDESTVPAWHPLCEILDAAPDEILLCDFTLIFGGREVNRKSRDPSYLWHALPTSHQAILYPGRLSRDIKYDLTLRVSADYGFTARLVALGALAKRQPITLARFHAGGYSTLSISKIRRDAHYVQKQILLVGVVRRFLSQIRHIVAAWRFAIKSRL